MLTTGSRIGSYDVGPQIGAGGMGEVYQATDIRLKRPVALKILPAAVAADPDRLARFQREAEVLAALSHSNIAASYGTEELDGTKALVMELVEGPTLADRIREGPLPVEDAFAIARQVADALETAHDQGIIHRDLKPANIKVRPDGSVKVLDFGLAKAVEPASAAVRQGVSQSPTITSPALTQAGMILGTAAYMSPEQARGRVVDRRADIWAFGCVLFEMLTGRRAFDGEDVTETLAAIVKSTPPWEQLPPLPPLTDLFLRQCLEKDPKKRLGDIREMRLALAGDLSLGPPSAAGAGARSWIKVAAVVVAAVFGAALIAAALSSRSREARPVTRFEYLLPQADLLPSLGRRVVAISADGRTLLYQSRSGLHVRSMGELDARLLPGTDAASDAVLSPDGQWVAFFSRPGELKKIPIAGGPAVTLCRIADIPYGVSWGTDGTIVFARSDGIARVSANGGEPQVIVQAAAGETIHRPQMMPSGDAVLFTVTTAQGNMRWDSARVVIHSLGSGRRTTLVEQATDAVYLPSGHLVYTKRDGLFGVAFDARTLTSSGGTVALVQGVQPSAGVAGGGVNFDVSNNGTLVYLVRRIEQRSVVWLSRRNGTVTPVTTIPPGTYEDPRLSPDGNRLLLTNDGDIWVFDLATGRTTRVTRDGGSQMGVWDPSGTRIAYSSGRTMGAVEAWVAPADGSGSPRQLTHMGGTVHVDSWSPDGKLLTIHHHRPPPAPTVMHMLAMDRPDAQPTPFPVGDFAAEGADFSPNGRHVVFLSNATGRREIYIRPYPGPGEQMTVSINGGFEPVWAANGEIFYRGLNGDQLYAVPVAAGSATKVGTPILVSSRPFYVAPTGSPRPQFDVTADGQRVVMLSSNMVDDRERVIVVQNWFEELRQRIPVN